MGNPVTPELVKKIHDTEALAAKVFREIETDLEEVTEKVRSMLSMVCALARVSLTVLENEDKK